MIYNILCFKGLSKASAKARYCGEDGDMLVVLLAGGDKGSQDKDIKKALEYWRDYHDQKKI